MAAIKEDFKHVPPEAAPAFQMLDRLDEIQASVLQPWSRAWTSRDAAAYGRLLAVGASLPAWNSSPRTLRRELDGLREYSWSPIPGGSDETAAYLSSFSRIESVELEVASVDATATAATIGLHFDLRGFVGHHVRRNDRGLISARVLKTAAGWQLAEVKPVSVDSIESLPARRPAFEDATASTGLDRIPVTDRSEAIRRGGYALATGDFDGDGQVDLLIGNYGPLKLYRNTGHGFEDVTAASGLRGETLVKSAVFADFDNDGRKDLLLVRFVDVGQPVLAGTPIDPEAGLADLVFYRNIGGGRFEYKGGDVLKREHHFDRAMPIAVADFDGNGTLDVYVGFPGARDFTNDLHKDAKAAYSLGMARQGVWFNDGKWGFTESAEWADSTDAATARPFPHSALAADLDGDGRPELVVVDDSGGASPVYQFGKDGMLHDVSAKMGLQVPGWNMAASAVDFDGDGLPDLVMTKVSLSPMELDSEKPLKDLTLFRNTGSGKFEEVSARAGLGYAGRGLAGAEWVDYNNDGLPDLYVANGLWTGGKEQTATFFARLSILRRLRPEGTVDAAMSRPDERGSRANPSLAILRDFHGSLSNPLGPPISDKPTLSLDGNQRNRLFRNNGDGTFTEVGFLENADRIEDGYVAAVADFDNDGRPDLVLRNADPAPGVQFPSVVLLHNQHPSAGAVVVHLVGTKDNTDGIGAQLTAWIGEKRLVREINSVSGATQSDNVAFFGLGHATRIDRLDIRWPSGFSEQFGPLKTGRFVLKEGTGRVVRASLDPSPKGIAN